MIIAIDPGLTGCTLVDNDGEITFYDHDKVDCFVEMLKDIYFGCKNKDKLFCIIEEQHTRPGASAASARTTFKNFYEMVGCIKTLGIAHQIISPNKWQKIIPRLPSSKDRKKHKRAIADFVHAIYPHAEIHGSRGGLLDGRSDALGILYYYYKEMA